MSLQQIMDEELARKMHTEDLAAVAAEAMGSADEAEAAAAPEAAPAAVEEAAAPSGEGEEAAAGEPEAVDEDLLLAMALQAEEDAAAAEAPREDWTSNAVAARGWFSTGYTPSYEYDDLDYDDEDYEGEGDDYGGGYASRSVVATRGKRFDRDHAGEIVTKHNATVSGRKNTRDLNRVMDSTTQLPRDRVLSNRVYNSMRRFFDSKTKKGQRTHGRVDAETFATQEGVLDEATHKILFKLLSSGRMDELNGVVRTGKESNVYHGAGWHDWDAPEDDLDEDDLDSPDDDAAEEGPSEEAAEGAGVGEDDVAAAAEAEATAVEEVAAAVPVEAEGEDGGDADAVGGAGGMASEEAVDGEEVAIKVFRTTLSEFKNRGDYIEGDHRFHGVNLHRKNPRKIGAQARSPSSDRRLAPANTHTTATVQCEFGRRRS